MQSTRFPEIFNSLLERIGIKEEEREAFLNPQFEKLHDPLLLPDMEKARTRIIKSIKDNEHIVVFSDYDADGIPGAVVLSDFFGRIRYENVSFYIPHRHDEGFGLNMGAIEKIAGDLPAGRQGGAKLIITVDCGIADAEEVDRANSYGIDVVITDHHEPTGRIPGAYAIVNPKIASSTYPFKELCGSGLAYKLVQAILDKEDFGVKKGMEKWSLDMVAIATLSDMVPLVGENRILAKFGLDVLRKSPRPGLQALCKKLNLDQSTLTEDDIAFMITPRINAASRMGTPEDAFNLLRTKDYGEAEVLAAHLEKINSERKGIVASLVKDAKKHLSLREKVGEVIVIGNPDWRPALLGLVANTLVEEYSRPVFVWGRDGDGVLKGSCRSYNGFDLCELMGKVREDFIEFGGHKGAGGFSVTLDKVGALEEKLSEAIKDLVSRAETAEEGLIINLSDISEDLWETISTFAPFGTGNEKPVFKIPQAEILSVRKFGKENNHLEIALSNGTKAISFFSSPENYSVPLKPAVKVNLLANLEKSYFRNRPELRLRIVDIKSA